MYSQTIYDKVIATMKENNLHYDEIEDMGMILIPHNSVENMGRTIMLTVLVRENDYVVRGHIDDFPIDDSYLTQVLELVMRINERYLYPFFLYDFEGFFGVTCLCYRDKCENMITSDEIMKDIYTVFTHFSKYGKVLIDVSLGLQNAKNAIEVIDAATE